MKNIKYYSGMGTDQDGHKYDRYKVGNIVILRRQDSKAQQAMLLSHGGYTPQRDFFRRGSGQVVVPPGLKIKFPTPRNDAYLSANAHSDIFGLLNGISYYETEEARPGDIVNNYALDYDDEAGQWFPSEKVDIVMLSSEKRSHLRDILEARVKLGLSWSVLHCMICRINKLAPPDYMRNDFA